MKNAELIARLREGQAYDFSTGEYRNMSSTMDDAADAIEKLEAEVERLTTLAHGQHIELYNARLQLAAAQGQEPVGTIHEDGYWVRANNPTGNAISDAMSIGKMNRLTVYAAPIPQQPAEPKRCKPCRDTGLLHCSDPENCGGPWTTPAPQPKETKWNN